MTLLIHDAFAFVHLPKAGGFWLTELLCQAGGKQKLPGGLTGHVPLSEIPEDLIDDKLVIGTMRNPWDWYVSYFHFFQHDNGLAMPELDGFQSSWIQEQEPDNSVARFRMVLPRLLNGPFCKVNLKDVGEIDPTAEMRQRDVGFMSWYASRMFGPGDPFSWKTNVLVDTHGMVHGSQLLKDLLERGRGVGWPNDIVYPSSRNEAPMGGPSHRHRKRPYGEYYTEELADLVRHKDRWIVEAFGYEGPGRPAVAPIFLHPSIQKQGVTL